MLGFVVGKTLKDDGQREGGMRNWAAILLAVCMTSAGCMAPQPLEHDVTRSYQTGHPLEGGPAPAYGAVDLDGRMVNLTDFAGQPVLLHIWASWCYICEQEEPELDRLYAEYGDRVAFVMVSIDSDRYEDAMRQEAGEWEFGSLWDPEDRIRPLFQVDYQPVSIFIDGNGTVDTVWQGQRADQTTLRANPDASRDTLDRLLA